MRFSSRTHFVLAVTASTALIVVLVGAIYLYRFSRELNAEAVKWSKQLARLLEEQAALLDPATQQKELQQLAEAFAAGRSVLYAQIIRDKTVLAEKVTDEAAGLDLPVTESPQKLELAAKQLPDGPPHLDIITSDDPAKGYVRLGVSLSHVSNAVKNALLLVAWVSLGVILLAGLFVFYLSRALFPSGQSVPDHQIKMAIGPLLIDDTSKQVQLNGRTVELSPKEYELLKLLASEPGRVFSNREILSKLWNDESFATSKDVKQYVYLLRQKLEESPQEPRMILTVRGFGYKLAP